MALLYSFLLFQNKYKITLYCRKPLPKCEHMFYNEFEVVNMIPNPNAPDEYKYETDYRKIPRQYLDANIPQGRGMVKWAPFATMPEQYQQLNDFIENRIKLPCLHCQMINSKISIDSSHINSHSTNWQ